MPARKHQLAVNVASLLTLQAANYVIPLVLLPFLARVLGIERFGLLSFVQAFCMYFVLVTEYGFNLSATRSVAAARDDLAALARIFWSTMVARALLGVACLVVLVVTVLMVPRMRPDLGAYLAGALAIVTAMITPTWYFQGREIIRSLAVSQLVGRVLTTAAIFVVVRGPEDVNLVLIVQGGGMLLVGLVSWIMMARWAPVPFHAVTWRNIWDRYTDGWHVFLSSAAISLYTTSNVFILGLLTSNTQVGYYSLAEKISRAACGFIGPVSQAVYPRIASLMVTSREQAFQLLNKVFWGLTAVGAAVFVLLVSVPQLFVEVIGGPGWEPAVGPLRWLSMLPLAVAVSSVLGTLTMLNVGLERPFAKIVAYSGVVNVAALAVGSLTLQADGAAIALCLTEWVVAALMAIGLRRRGLLMNVIGSPQRLRTVSA
jgi:O-antigen/teichoic acid export membrane protein